MPLTIRFVTRYSHVTARGGLMCDETIEKACVWTGGVRDAQSVCTRQSGRHNSYVQRWGT